MLTGLSLVVFTITLGISAGAAVASRTGGRVVPVTVGIGVFVVGSVPVALLTGMMPFFGG
jgi:hypothetical protein